MWMVQIDGLPLYNGIARSFKGVASLSGTIGKAIGVGKVKKHSGGHRFTTEIQGADHSGPDRAYRTRSCPVQRHDRKTNAFHSLEIVKTTKKLGFQVPCRHDPPVPHSMPCIASRKAEPRLEICIYNLCRWTDDGLILCILTDGGQGHDDVDACLHGGTEPVSVVQARLRLFKGRGVAQHAKWLRAGINGTPNSPHGRLDKACPSRVKGIGRGPYRLLAGFGATVLP